jgi:hypothetical protein
VPSSPFEEAKEDQWLELLTSYIPYLHTKDGSQSAVASAEKLLEAQKSEFIHGSSPGLPDYLLYAVLLSVGAT